MHDFIGPESPLLVFQNVFHEGKSRALHAGKKDADYNTRVKNQRRLTVLSKIAIKVFFASEPGKKRLSFNMLNLTFRLDSLHRKLF
jgi:hypothetical protein